MNDLLDFVNEELLRESRTKVDAQTPLFEGGVIDSLKILQLIAFVEMKMGGKLPDSEVVMEHFRTVETIARRFLSHEPIGHHRV